MSPATLSPLTTSTEFNVLIACARVNASSDELRSCFERVRDWQGLSELALRHGMLPLMYSSILRARPKVPRSALGELQSINRANAEKSIRLTAALLRILAVLNAEGVFAVPFKGPLLSQDAYGDLTMRNFQDLDLLVAKPQAVQASEVLASHGFLREHQYSASRPSGEEEFHHMLRRDGITVELHWQTGPPYVPAAFQDGELLERSRPCTLLGRPVQTLDPADLLLALCIHGYAHRWSQLEHVATLARVLARGEFGDSAAFLRNARSRGALRRCLVGLLLANRLAGAQLSLDFQRALKSDRIVDCLASKARLFDSSPGFVGPRLGAAVWRGAALDKPTDGLRMIALQILAPRDQDVVDAKSSRLRVAPLIRLRRLLASVCMRRRARRRSSGSS